MHWLTEEDANELIANARKAAYEVPPAGAGFVPNGGPFGMIQLQVCECAFHKGKCDKLRLVIDGRIMDGNIGSIGSAEELMLAVQRAEAAAVPPVQ